MMDFADDLNFEEAAKLRDEIKRLENNELELSSNSNIVYKKKRKKESTLLNVYRFLHTVNRIISSLYSADKMIESADAIAKKFNLSPVLIGLTIVAFGTSAPEIVITHLLQQRLFQLLMPLPKYYRI